MESTYLTYLLYDIRNFTNLVEWNFSQDNYPDHHFDFGFYPDDFHSAFNVFFYMGIFVSIICLLGTPENMLVIWIAGFKMKTINAVWILHLAIADLICCVFLSFVAVHLFTLYYLHFSYSYELEQVHKIGVTSVYFSAYTSVTLLTAMSIDRCISVIWPVWYKTHRTSKNVHITAAVIWVMNLILCGIRSYYTHYYRYSRNLTDYILTILFTSCFIIIITCYSLLCIKVKKVKQPKRSQRPYRVITALIICFIICWGPYYIYDILTNYINWHVDNVIYFIIVCLVSLNSCINPIIYVFIGQDFKETLMDSLPPGIQRALNKCCNQSPRKPGSVNEDFPDTDV